LHPSGNLVVCGRIKDVINRSGEKIAVGELEALIQDHPAVAEVAVVGMQNGSSETPDEEICVFAVLGDGKLTLRGLRAYLIGRGIAPYKLPDHLEVVDAIPRTPVGKPAKNLLQRMAVPKRSSVTRAPTAIPQPSSR
jgi:2,3-dihydroxybenzoate-AMP ligase